MTQAGSTGEKSATRCETQSASARPEEKQWIATYVEIDDVIEIGYPLKVGRRVIATVEVGLHEPAESEQRAAARLIAAAPEMLAMLKQYASECATCGGCGECDLPVDGNDDELESVDCIDCTDIRALIAKAEGRSNG
jgi:hypothetical protein